MTNQVEPLKWSDEPTVEGAAYIVAWDGVYNAKTDNEPWRAVKTDGGWRMTHLGPSDWCGEPLRSESKVWGPVEVPAPLPSSPIPEPSE